MKNEWIYTDFCETYVFGTPDNGAGVYKEKNGEYFGSVVVNNDFFLIGPYKDLKEAKEKAVEEFENKRREE
jgi:hypothetical protein